MCWTSSVNGFINVSCRCNWHEFALPHSRIMLHQPSGGFSGQATDIEIHAKEILDMKEKLNKIYEKHTKQKIDVIRKPWKRLFFAPAEAKKFGIIDEIIDNRNQVKFS